MIGRCSKIISLLILFYYIDSSNAFSNGAGTCNSGESINLGHPGDRSGHVDAASSFSMMIDDETLENNSINYIEQISNTISLKDTSTSGKFKGFLLRLEKKNSDTIGATLDSLSTAAKEKSGCNSNVVAMTHTSSSPKEEISFELEFELDAEYILEVTVVRERAIWYYSKMEFVQPPPTASPSKPPTTYPTTSASPTTSPTASISPSTSPSTSPSSSTNPTSFPSMMKSASPSSSPSTIPSAAPTASPTISPSTHPSSYPSAYTCMPAALLI